VGWGSPIGSDDQNATGLISRDKLDLVFFICSQQALA